MDHRKRTIRAGLLGASSVSTYAMIEPARRNENIEVVAVAARDPERAHLFAQKHGIAEVASSYSDLIERTDLDLIYIGLPPIQHAHWALRSLEAGKAALCEKPLAINASEAEEMVSMATTTARPLIEALHYRFHPTMARALEIVRCDLGPLRSMQATVASPAPTDPDDIRWRADLGGGALLDLGCYAVHALRTLAGGEPVIRAASRIMRSGVDLTTHATLAFDRCEHARILCSFDSAAFINSLRVVGERGTLDIEGFMLPQRGGVLRLTIGGRTHESPLAAVTTYDEQLAHVAQVLHDERLPLTGGADGIANARALDAIRIAAERS